MTNLDQKVRELRALADKATPGDWTNGTDPCHFDAPEVTDGKTFAYWVPDEHNAAYIAAANPATLSAILDEYDRRGAALVEAEGALRLISSGRATKADGTFWADTFVGGHCAASEERADVADRALASMKEVGK